MPRKSHKTAYVIGGVIVAGLFWWLAPWWLTLLVILAIIAIPVGGYLMLDPAQRRRLKGLRSRGQLGR